MPPYPDPFQMPIVPPFPCPKTIHFSSTGVPAVPTTPARYPQPRGTSAATRPGSCSPITPTPSSPSGSNAHEVMSDVPGASTDAPPSPVYQYPPNFVPMYHHMRVAGSPPPVSAIAPPANALAQADKMQPPKIGTQAMPGDSPGASSGISGASNDSPGASTDPVGASPPPTSLYTTVVPSYQRMRDTKYPQPPVSAIPTAQSAPLARSFSASPAPTPPRSSKSSSHTWSLRSTFSNLRNRQSAPSGHAAADHEIVGIKFGLYSTAGRVGLDALCRFRHDHERHMPEPDNRAMLDSNPPCASCARMLKVYHCDAGMVYRDFAKFCEDHAVSLHAVPSRQYSKTICLQLSCQALKKMDLFSPSDPYANITYRTSAAGPWEDAARSRVQKKEANPVFEELKFSIFGSSGEELDEAEICIEILDSDFFTKDDPIGRFLTTPTGLARLKKGDKVQLEGYGTENQRSSDPFVGFIRVDDFKDHPATPLA